MFNKERYYWISYKGIDNFGYKTLISNGMFSWRQMSNWISEEIDDKAMITAWGEFKNKKDFDQHNMIP